MIAKYFSEVEDRREPWKVKHSLLEIIVMVITAVPALLDLLDIEGCAITADAMSCQKEITAKITQGKANYVLGLKENQPSLYTDVMSFSKAARAHWGIENSLHWCLDVVFDEDHIRMRKDNSAENMAVVRHIGFECP